MELLRTYITVVEPLKVPADACRDADDLPVLGTLLRHRLIAWSQGIKTYWF